MASRTTTVMVQNPESTLNMCLCHTGFVPIYTAMQIIEAQQMSQQKKHEFSRRTRTKKT